MDNARRITAIDYRIAVNTLHNIVASGRPETAAQAQRILNDKRLFQEFLLRSCQRGSRAGAKEGDSLRLAA